MVESYHWHLDVTFRENANHTVDKYAAYNLNIIKKIVLNMLKILEMVPQKSSLKSKRFRISLNVEKYLKKLMTL